MLPASQLCRVVHACACMCACTRVCEHRGVLEHMQTAACPQSGLRVSQSQEATKEDSFKDLGPLDRRRESLGRQGYSHTHFREQPKGDGELCSRPTLGLGLGSATNWPRDPGLVTYCGGLRLAHE